MLEIIKFQPLQKGALQSIVDIKIPKWGNFIIRKIKVFEKASNRWIGFPSEEYEKDGKKQYYSLCVFEENSTMDLFHKRFFESYDKYVQTLQEKTNNEKSET